jgi:hypothetical protein
LPSSSAVALALNVCILWFLGRWLNSRPVKVLIDPESGKRLVANAHSLFWIPLQYWAIPWLVYGVVFAFQE